MPTKSTARMPALRAGLCRNEEAIGPHSRNTTPPAASERDSPAIVLGGDERSPRRRSRIRRNDVDTVRRLSFGLQAERAHVHARGPDVLLEQVLADVDAALQ